jgi:hypothetical protein
MARHHQNPIGDRSGACRLAEPVSVAVGPAATVLNLTALFVIVVRGMAAPGNRDRCVDLIPNGPHSSAGGCFSGSDYGRPMGGPGSHPTCAATTS